MNVITLNLSEYEKFQGEPKWGVSEMCWQLYWFFRDREQVGCHYLISYESEGDRMCAIPDSWLNTFRLYGIEFIYCDSNRVPNVINDRHYLMTVKLNWLFDDDLFDTKIRNRWREFSNDDVGTIIIDCDEQDNLQSIPEIQRYECAKKLQSVFPNAIIANRDFSVYKVDQNSSNNFLDTATKLTDLVGSVEQLRQKCSSMNSTESILKQMLYIIDAVGKSPNKCDLIDAADFSTTFQLCSQEAIEYICLMRFGKRVYFSDSNERLILGLAKDVMSQSGMYADEYLTMLANLPDVSVYYRSEPVLVMPNYNDSFYSDVKIQAIEAEFDLSKDEIIGECSVQSYNYDHLELLSASELFNLSSKDFNIALEGMNRLAKVFDKFGKKSASIIDLRGVLFNVSNMLFYRIEDKTYIAYLGNVSAETKFVAYAVRSRSKPFHLTLDVAKETLFDVRFFMDWKTIMAPYVRNKIVRLNHMFFKPPRYINGLCMYLQPSLQQVCDCNLTFEEVGMFAKSSWDMRRNLEILDYLKRDVVVDRIATPFGGMHAMMNTIVKINREDWRSNADRIQQFNTYGH